MGPKNLHIASGTFTFRLIPTIIAGVMLTLLIGLGIWQVERLHWKEDLIAEIKSRMQEPEIDVGLSTIADESIPKFDYRPGRATGTFDNAHELYLNAISIDGKGGYDLLTPLLLEDGRALLVNRGWMPYAEKDEKGGSDWDRATGVGDRDIYRPQKPVTVTGVLRLPPDTKPSMRPDNNPGKNDWYWIDLKSMASSAGVKEFTPYMLEADDAPHDGAWPIGGQTRLDIPNHHLQYAITWFWLALILPFIYFVSNWRLDRPKKVEETEKPVEDKPA